MFTRGGVALVVLLAGIGLSRANDRPIQGEGLNEYIRRMQQPALELKPASPGSLWNDSGQFARLSSDYKRPPETSSPSWWCRT